MSMQFGNQKVTGIKFMSDGVLSNVVEVCRYVDGVKETFWKNNVKMTYHTNYDKLAPKNLMMKSVNGNNCYFEASHPQILSSLGYVTKDNIVREPYNMSADISSFNSVVEVNDYSNQILNVDTYAFCNCTNIIHANLPAAINIQKYAFENCTNLSSINIPSVQVIWTGPFSGCSNLSSLSCPKVSSIKKSAFTGCSKLSSVILSSVTTPTSIYSDSFGEKRDWIISVYVASGMKTTFDKADVWRDINVETGSGIVQVVEVQQ